MIDLPPDPTLDELRAALAPLIAANAAFDGWRTPAVEAAAREAGIDEGVARLAFDSDRRGSGAALDMIDAWFDSIDTRMAMLWPPEKIAGLGVGRRITALIETRLELLTPDREALRRALAILAMPTNAVRAAKLAWRTADRMWRAAGDGSVDFNYYSKRATLVGVYASTVLVFLDDESEALAETRAFLARRIADTGRIGKAKARMQARADRTPSLSRFLGRLRYPAR